MGSRFRDAHAGLVETGEEINSFEFARRSERSVCLAGAQTKSVPKYSNLVNSEPTASDFPKVVAGRLSLYLRELQQMSAAGQMTTSSSALAKRLGQTASQVRKDFAYFGQFGRPGIGYSCEDLIEKIRLILGTDRVWPVALVGCGNLGQALLGYRGFGQQGFAVAAAFDKDPALIGCQFEGLTVQDISELAKVTAAKSLELAILAVPATAAAAATESIVAAGIPGILNFAPVTLKTPGSVSVVGVDLAIQLEQLAFGVVKKRRTNP